MANINEVVVNYLDAWNERDERRRREIVARTWSDEGSYVDPARHGEGHEKISAMIGEAQSHFPGYSLCLASGIQAHNGFVRFTWETVGTAKTPLRIVGTDFATLSSDGRLKSVVGFVDAAPVPAR